MKQIFMSSLFIFLLSMSAFASEDNCKTLKSCSDWASGKTGAKYDLGKWEKRSLKQEKDLTINEGDSDFVFNFILQSNDLLRLKRENGAYQIIAIRDMKDYQFPAVKLEEIPASLDFYTAEFLLSNKEKVTNAKLILKKLLSKNGRMLEIADSNKLQIVDNGFHLNTIKLMISELNK
jgi:hypothetical protein